MSLTPDQVVETVKRKGFSISRRTLYNYEKEGLVPKPIFRNSRTTLYPEDTPDFLIKAWQAVHSDRYKRAKELMKQ